MTSKDKNSQSGLSVNHKAGFGFTSSVCFHEEHAQLSLIWLRIYGGGGKDLDTCRLLEQVSGSMLLHNLPENLHLTLNKTSQKVKKVSLKVSLKNKKKLKNPFKASDMLEMLFYINYQQRVK